MVALKPTRPSVVLIDFAAGTQGPYFSYVTRRPFGSITVSRCTFNPSSGAPQGSTQVMVAVHASAPYELEWRDPETGNLRRQMIERGAVHVVPAGVPVFQRWTVPLRALVIALDVRFVERTSVAAFGRPPESLSVMIGIADPVLQRLAALCEAEIDESRRGGRLYAESLGAGLVVHLLRRYGAERKAPRTIRGGLTSVRLRRTTDYIQSHLDEDLSLDRMAAVAGLNPYHFAHAFKAVTGLPPHHFVVDRRIARACELLADPARSIAEVAYTVGFSSQSHFTLQFRRLVGVTPAQFRRYR